MSFSWSHPSPWQSDSCRGLRLHLLPLGSCPAGMFSGRLLGLGALAHDPFTRT